MTIEEKIFEIYQKINEIQGKIDCLHELNYNLIHSYTRQIFELKKELQKLEYLSFLERNPDIESNEIDLYLKNLHVLHEENPNRFSYIITFHGTKKRIGIMDIRFSLLENEKYLGNIGANIEEKYRGNRYSKKAFVLLKDVMLEHGLKKPIFTVNDTNISSIKSLDAIGAKRVDYVHDVEEPYYVYEYDLEQEEKNRKK